MIAHNHRRICEKAKLFYYDFLFSDDTSQIPEQFLSHIRECHNCQKRINELKTTLNQVEQKKKNVQINSVSPLTNVLKRHFSYIDLEITCKIVKPFLPSLLNSSTQINIPTPITTQTRLPRRS